MLMVKTYYWQMGEFGMAMMMQIICVSCSICALTMYKKHHLLIPWLCWCSEAIPNLTILVLETDLGNLVLVGATFLMMQTLEESNH